MDFASSDAAFRILPNTLHVPALASHLRRSLLYGTPPVLLCIKLTVPTSGITLEKEIDAPDQT